MTWPHPENPLPIGVRQGWGPSNNWWFRIYHEDRFSPDAVSPRTNGPRARFDHHELPLNSPDEDPRGRSVIYVGEDLATAAAEVFRTEQALICPHFRVAQLSPTGDCQVQDITGLGARAIGAMPLLADTLDYEVTTRWARAIYAADLAGIRYHSAQGGGLDSMAIWDRAPGMTCMAELALDSPEMAGRIELVLTKLRVAVRFISEVSCTRCLRAGTISDADFVPPGVL